ncbi:histidine phosphatase family protein [Neptuniibacter sp. CAU 1671]|uniref:SixA phosphatase family protein n=1 Tax=Neptuniibacter sp. CAU 1671 TaxID=3032593 RepID=UPI0023DC6E8E|nr:histidine phosphatase family protein [Neptuniibacter sp. CAU 1671]MDF2180645.1 histidine phosphatase family protein [Neptuniibacter sp. CAU 1671]
MKRLTLIRHAKSSWKHEGLRDFERPLNRRGWCDAPLMAERFAASGEIPTLIITSYATRALTTARIFALHLDIPIAKLQLNDKVYEASAEDLLELVRSTPDYVTHLCIVGHNPGLNGLVALLGVGSVDNIPTTGIVALTLETDVWSEAGEASATMNYSDSPKQPGTH